VDRETDWKGIMKKQKQPLFLKGYETNPQGKRVPIYTTVEPVVPYHVIEGASLPGARKKTKGKKAK
jgi:hypothetical protein